HGQFHILVVDDDRGLDFAGADHLDVDALFRQGAEHQAGHTHVAAHAYTHDGDLANLVVGSNFFCAHGRADLILQQFQGAGEIVAIHREGKVGGTFDGLILQNHVDVDVGSGNGAKNRVGHARGIGYGQQGDFGFIAAKGNARNN